ncbi:MAG TPA: hypothetical protein VM468_12010 [Mycoplana sp.]|jgi:hypothetical protein|nr:hypothetical protein [Mycoplana sp.]
MIRSSLVAAFVLLPSLASASDATAPVREIMAAVTQNWVDVADGDDSPPEYVDYFNAGFLERLYSKDFIAKYREAARYPAYDDGGSPFDYDVIAMGQDGCSINDLKIEAAGSANGVTTVRTTFDNTHCFGERAPDWKPAEVDFTVIEENGKPVIDDILRPQDGDPGSLKAELGEITRQGANPSAEVNSDSD